MLQQLQRSNYDVLIDKSDNISRAIAWALLDRTRLFIPLTRPAELGTTVETGSFVTLAEYVQRPASNWKTVGLTVIIDGYHYTNVVVTGDYLRHAKNIAGAYQTIFYLPGTKEYALNLHEKTWVPHDVSICIFVPPSYINWHCMFLAKLAKGLAPYRSLADDFAQLPQDLPRTGISYVYAATEETYETTYDCEWN